MIEEYYNALASAKITLPLLEVFNKIVSLTQLPKEYYLIFIHTCTKSVNEA